MAHFARERLLTPGPVAVAAEVLAAIARPPIHHRSPVFRALLLDVRRRLADVLQVPGDDVLVLTTSGTGAFEAALLAAVPEGAAVLCVEAGRFAQRWREMAERYRYRVDRVEVEWGRCVDPERVAAALRHRPDTAAVLLVHSETSTGVLEDIEVIAAAVREVAPEALILVDAVTSFTVTDLQPRAWGLDAVVSGSQKGVMVPPGLAFAWLSERAWQRQGPFPASYTLDLRAERLQQRDGQTGATPAVNLVFGLDVALQRLLSEGIEEVWARRARANQALLAAGRATGLRPFAERPSPALAALETPDGIASADVVAAAAARGVRIAGGQGRVKARLLRPSLLGDVDRYDAVVLAAALEDAMRDVGVAVTRGAGVAAALAVLDAPTTDR